MENTNKDDTDEVPVVKELVKRKASSRVSSFVPKKKRKRTVISKTDLEQLECLFLEDKWPSRRKKEILADKLEKSEEFINTWFQNRRAKHRRLQKETFDELDTDDQQLQQQNLIFHDLSPQDAKTSAQKLKKEKKFDSYLKLYQDKNECPVSWGEVFLRLVCMVAASEGAMTRKNPSFASSVKDAALGIKIKNAKLVYNREFGFDMEDQKLTRSALKNPVSN